MLVEDIEICYFVCFRVVLVIGYESVMIIHDLNSIVFMNAPQAKGCMERKFNNVIDRATVLIVV